MSIDSRGPPLVATGLRAGRGAHLGVPGPGHGAGLPARGAAGDRTTALLGLLQVGLETGLYLALAAGVARARSWFRRPRIRRRLEAVSGTVLVALGLRVAVSGR